VRRDSGEPVFGVEERPVPQSDAEGEQAWPTQPFPVAPPPPFPGNLGGMNWSSGAFDPQHQIYVTNINNVPVEVHLIPRDRYARTEREATQGRFRAEVSPQHGTPAFDVATGAELWKTALPAGGQATPMTYRVRGDGKQFVVIAAGGHGKLGTRLGDSLIAYALPSIP
jgi:glucose dehydrogenase